MDKRGAAEAEAPCVRLRRAGHGARRRVPPCDARGASPQRVGNARAGACRRTRTRRTCRPCRATEDARPAGTRRARASRMHRGSCRTRALLLETALRMRLARIDGYGRHGTTICANMPPALIASDLLRKRTGTALPRNRHNTAPPRNCFGTASEPPRSCFGTASEPLRNRAASGPLPNRLRTASEPPPRSLSLFSLCLCRGLCLQLFLPMSAPPSDLRRPVLPPVCVTACVRTRGSHSAKRCGWWLRHPTATRANSRGLLSAGGVQPARRCGRPQGFMRGCGRSGLRMQRAWRWWSVVAGALVVSRAHPPDLLVAGATPGRAAVRASSGRGVAPFFTAPRTCRTPGR